jgi:hypothetical protein
MHDDGHRYLGVKHGLQVLAADVDAVAAFETAGNHRIGRLRAWRYPVNRSKRTGTE